jgi:hypothetical protein
MWKHIFAHYSVSTCGKLPNFVCWCIYKIYITYLMGFDLDLLFKVTEVKIPKITQCDTTSQLLPIHLLDRSMDQVETFTCVWYSSTNVHNTLRILIQLLLFPPGCDMWKHIFDHNSTSTCGKATKFCPLVHLWNLHNISCGFWPWPTFQGHGCHTSKIYTNAIQLRNYCRHLLLDRSTDQVEIFSGVRYSSTNVHNTLRISIQLPSFSIRGQYVKTHFFPLLHRFLW